MGCVKPSVRPGSGKHSNLGRSEATRMQSILPAVVVIIGFLWQTVNPSSMVMPLLPALLVTLLRSAAAISWSCLVQARQLQQAFLISVLRVEFGQTRTVRDSIVHRDFRNVRRCFGSGPWTHLLGDSPQLHTDYL